MWDEKKILQNLLDLKNGLVDPGPYLVEGCKRLMSPLIAGSWAIIESIKDHGLCPWISTGVSIHKEGNAIWS